MNKIKVTEETPRTVCSEELKLAIEKLGVKQDGKQETLEVVLKGWGFRFPSIEEIDGTVYYGFHQTIGEKTYTHLYMNYADALAEEILFVFRHGMREMEL